MSEDPTIIEMNQKKVQFLGFGNASFLNYSENIENSQTYCSDPNEINNAKTENNSKYPKNYNEISETLNYSETDNSDSDTNNEEYIVASKENKTNLKGKTRSPMKVIGKGLSNFIKKPSQSNFRKNQKRTISRLIIYNHPPSSEVYHLNETNISIEEPEEPNNSQDPNPNKNIVFPFRPSDQSTFFQKIQKYKKNPLNISNRIPQQISLEELGNSSKDPDFTRNPNNSFDDSVYCFNESIYAIPLYTYSEFQNITNQESNNSTVSPHSNTVSVDELNEGISSLKCVEDDNSSKMDEVIHTEVIPDIINIERKSLEVSDIFDKPLPESITVMRQKNPKVESNRLRRNNHINFLNLEKEKELEISINHHSKTFKESYCPPIVGPRTKFHDKNPAKEMSAGNNSVTSREILSQNNDHQLESELIVHLKDQVETTTSQIPCNKKPVPRPRSKKSSYLLTKQSNVDEKDSECSGDISSSFNPTKLQTKIPFLQYLEQSNINRRIIEEMENSPRESTECSKPPETTPNHPEY